MKIKLHWKTFGKTQKNGLKTKKNQKLKRKYVFLPYSKTHFDFINNDFSAKMVFFIRTFRIIPWSEIFIKKSVNGLQALIAFLK